MADGSRILKPRITASVLLSDLVMVACAMREDEKDQWCAVTGASEYDPDAAARSFADQHGPSYCLLDGDGTPVLVAGFAQVRPWVWQAWMAGSLDAWEKHWRLITRECKRIGDALLATDAHRLQILALPERTAAHRWYEALGYRYEARLAQFFADGRDAVCYVKTRAR